MTFLLYIKLLTEHYQKNKEKLQKKGLWKVSKSFWNNRQYAREQYRSFSEEEKNKNREYRRKRYIKNFEI